MVRSPAPDGTAMGGRSFNNSVPLGGNPSRISTNVIPLLPSRVARLVSKVKRILAVAHSLPEQAMRETSGGVFMAAPLMERWDNETLGGNSSIMPVACADPFRIKFTRLPLLPTVTSGGG